MSDEARGHGGWEKAQMVLTLLTGIVGVWLSIGQRQISDRVSEIQATQTTVESVSRYFNLLVDTSSSKRKMAAYAIYMLKKDDPEMVVSLVLASDRPGLLDVLVDLARRDSLIQKQIAKVVTSQNDTAVAPSAQSDVQVVQRAESVLSQVVTTGWSYMGSFKDGAWTHGPTIQVGAGLPAQGRTYAVRIPLYIREEAPDPKTYQHAAVQGVLAPDDQIRIDELRTNVVGSRVWARISVLKRVEPAAVDSAAAVPMS